MDSSMLFDALKLVFLAMLIFGIAYLPGKLTLFCIRGLAHSLKKTFRSIVDLK